MGYIEITIISLGDLIQDVGIGRRVSGYVTMSEKNDFNLKNGIYDEPL